MTKALGRDECVDYQPAFISAHQRETERLLLAGAPCAPQRATAAALRQHPLTLFAHASQQGVLTVLACVASAARQAAPAEAEETK